MGALIGLAALSVGCLDDSGSGGTAGGKPRAAKAPLSFRTVQIKQTAHDMVSIRIEVTNATRHRIKSAEATCIALDGSGREVGSARDYIIKPAARTLAPGDSTYCDYLIKVSDPAAVKDARVRLEIVKVE